MPSSDLKNNRIKKILLNIGLGEAVTNKKVLEAGIADLTAISGQKPKVTQAKVAIAGFKIRKGDTVGLMVTLRGKRMKDFLTKLFSIVLPRLRDFQGLSRDSFDGQGNYSLGIPEQIVFPEIDYEKIDKIRGLQITIVTNARSDKKAEKLLEGLGMPFTKKESKNGEKSKNIKRV